jgi:pyruvate/2-oxoglutarate dehydrogenase complex dihydrolipoamide acyltransferase (E2) component
MPSSDDCHPRREDAAETGDPRFRLTREQTHCIPLAQVQATTVTRGSSASKEPHDSRRTGDESTAVGHTAMVTSSHKLPPHDVRRSDLPWAAGATVAAGDPASPAAASSRAVASTAASSASRNGAGGADGRIFSSPLVRRLAKEVGLSIADIRGTGPGGRIVRRDVEQAASPSRSITGRSTEQRLRSGWRRSCHCWRSPCGSSPDSFHRFPPRFVGEVLCGGWRQVPVAMARPVIEAALSAC